MSGTAPTGDVLVTLIDQRTGGPAAGVAVQLGSAGGALHGTTDAVGKVHFERILAGRTLLTIAGWPGCRTSWTVDVAPNRANRFELRLCADAVAASNAADEHVIAMLDITTQDAAGSAACSGDVLAQGIGIAELAQNALPTGHCTSGVAVFTARHAIAYSLDASTLPWTASFGDVHHVTLPPLPLRVPVRVFVASTEEVTAMETQLTAAQQAYDHSHAGIEFVDSESGGEVQMEVATAEQLAVIGGDCSSVAEIRRSPTLYAPGRLNVYAVLGDDSQEQGVTCAVELAPEIILMKPDASAHNTLAHEIGHALGLLRPVFGHTNPLAGFTKSNIMRFAGTLEPNAYFSIGQVTRMTFDGISWVNRPSAADGSSLRKRLAPTGESPFTTACGCPETAATATCPALNKDIARWAPVGTGNGAQRACGVASISVTTLTCNEATEATATLSPIDAAGEAKWYSDDPSRLTVVRSNSDLRGAVLTGHLNGPARVHVSGSGSAATFPLLISGC
ncbi:MAG: hypothetical protein IT355_05705 [Gemmatimonadaceae bacterium]|nr:hypothetical protein [Gemmatimonadaceae bacterium]